MRYLVICVLFSCLVGCSAMETLRDDYLDVDEYDANTMYEAGQDLKYDFLGAEKPFLEKDEKSAVLFVSQNRLLLTEYKDKFLLSEAYIDEDPGLPEAFSYIFVHIPPKPEYPELAGSTYLFVYRRIEQGKIIYEELFTPSKGDSFYRYNNILKKLTLH